jgi:glycosyltransferase involved in cell wall biosynthesis
MRLTETSVDAGAQVTAAGLVSPRLHGRVWIVSRCAWTLHNFRLGLMREMQDRGIAVISMGAGGDGFDSKLRQAKVAFAELPVDKRGINPFADVRLFWRLLRKMRNQRPALVHLFTIKPVIYGGLAARLAGVPIIATVTGLGHVFTSGSKPLRLGVEWLYQVALKHADVVFFQNADDQGLFIQRGLVPACKTRLVPGSGVDIERFGFIEPEKAARPPVFLMVARLIREKGVVEYLKAAGRLRHQFPGVKCLLVGAPDERNPSALSVAEIEKLTKEAGVEWNGAADDVRPWIAKADVVVLPSYREGIPRSMLEAAAMGRALITTDTVGCREAVDPEVNGLLIPVKSVDALVNAMKQLVEKPALIAKFGVASREKVVREFDERIVIERTLEAYKELGVCGEIQQ